jgi:HD-GYP domain-containing protein (c-di-GMP phosphodiesterase class II)
MKRMLALKLTLLSKFSIVSLGLLLVLGLALAWGIQRHLEQNALQQEAESAAEQVISILGPNIKSADLRGPLDPSRYAQIDALIRQNLLTEHIARVKIWSPDGLIIYSDDKSLVGKRFPVEDDLIEALSGETHMDVSSLQDDENIDERKHFSQLLEIYVPLRPLDAPKAMGVFEIYHDMTALQARIDDMRFFVWASVGLGFLVLYSLLFTLVRNASRDLTRRNTDNARLYKEAMERLAERQRAEEEIKRQLSRLAALRNIDMAIIASLDLRVTLSIILEQVTTQLNVDAAGVLLLNQSTQMLEYVAGRGFRLDAAARPSLRLGEGYAGRAALERQTIPLPDLTGVDNSVHGHLLADEGFMAYYVVPLIAKGQVKGVLEVFHRARLNPDAEWLTFLEALAGQAAIALDNATLFDELQRSNTELSLAYDTTLEGWSRALDLRDKETEGHTQRVTEMTMRLARAMGIAELEMVHMRRGALLHDIGKMAIPDSILLKPGPLTDAEWDIMRLHPVYAYKLLSPIPFLRPALDIPYCHHEKWDGTGYPRGLKGEQIPVAARIFAVVDVWDALRSDRPYRSAWPEDRVLDYIRSLAGTHFDPRAVDAFLEMYASQTPLAALAR